MNPDDWIKCSERLPFREDWYEATIESEGKRRYVEALYFEYDKWRRYMHIFVDGAERDEAYSLYLAKNEKVIAWRHLPEPYKGEV